MPTELFFRRKLPHWQPLGVPFFITYRLAGALPKDVINKLEKKRQQLQDLPRESGYSRTEWNIRIQKKLFAIWDEHLDKGISTSWLTDPLIAAIVRDNLYYHAESKYSLWAYVIMPNHVHALLQPNQTWTRQFESLESDRTGPKKGPLSAILHSLRSYTANEANRILGRTGVFWQPEAFDHWVRNNSEFQRIILYIENNPVKAGLAKHSEDWRFSSAYDRVQRGLGPFEKLV